MQIHMKSERGEIEVFLCPEEEALGMTSEDSAAEDTDSEAAYNSPLKIKKEIVSSFADSGSILSQNSTPQPTTSQLGGSPPTQTWEAPSRTGDNESDIKNVLIWESEDFGPIGNRFQQQTVDQDHGKFFRFFFSSEMKLVPVDGPVACDAVKSDICITVAVPSMCSKI